MDKEEKKEFGNRLRKELEDIFRENGLPPERQAPCAHHRMALPPGCIMGWDMSDCNYCSFYQPVDLPGDVER